MIDATRQEDNKQEILSLLYNITREGANVHKLINKLESSDFFTAPASTKNHLNTEGGLAEHSVNVYYNLKHLVKYKQLEDTISEESIIITALLHDISKMNVYEKTAINKKIYSEHGTKQDDLGKFYWATEYSYKHKDPKNCFIYHNHEVTSEYMIRQFIPLTLEESIAITHHMGGLGYDSAEDNVSLVFATHPLAALLHTADMLATFVDEGNE